MPRYHFDLANGGAPFEDTEGSELPNDQEAVNEALLFLAESGRDFLPGITPPATLALTLREESGREVARLTLSVSISRLKEAH
ncbi:hypothetical protein [Devosia sp. 1566]|uniref:DUF6894 family protein n=1 Tax=Devosia sp. 1566 TaxID=2499144 RepID=UPI000FDA068E|nr:hypothetical protein [Devosia sp. 1566]